MSELIRDRHFCSIPLCEVYRNQELSAVYGDTLNTAITHEAAARPDANASESAAPRSVWLSVNDFDHVYDNLMSEPSLNVLSAETCSEL